MRITCPAPAISVLLAYLVAQAGCSEEGPLTSYPIRVDAEGASSAELHLEYEGGVLMLQPVDPEVAADSPFLLIDARTDREALRPIAESKLEGDVLAVRVHQPEAQSAFGKRSRNEWRAALDPQIATQIRIDAGVLGGTLLLGGLNLPRIEVHVNQGELDVDYTRAPVTTRTELLIELGHGYVRVRVPVGIPVRVRAREAVGKLIVLGIPEVEDAEDGEYADADFEGAEVRIDVTLGVMMGQLLVERVSPEVGSRPGRSVDDGAGDG